MADRPFSFLDIANVEPLTIVDVGASALEETAAYHEIAARTGSRVIGFEPDQSACTNLNAAARPGHTYFPLAIGAGGSASLYETVHPLSSSLYKPDAELLKHFTMFDRLMAIKRVHTLDTHRLDDVVSAAEIDFLKMDVQGAELDVLRGAERLLPSILMIQTEVEFLPIYEHQPLFADVDKYLRAAGFQLHKFFEFRKPFYTPLAAPNGTIGDFSQVMWTDAVYIPDVRSLHRVSSERLLKLVTLLHDLHGSIDLCAHILMLMRERGNDVPFDAYIGRCMALHRA